MDNRIDTRSHYRSLFWPILLIGVGVIWLLGNLGYLSTANLYEIWRLWPVLLIVAGLDILFGRRIPAIGALLGLLVVGGVVLFLITGQRLPGAASPQVVTDHLALPVEQAKQAKVTLNFWSDPVSVFAASDPQQLIDAQITHTGQIDFKGTGQETKTVSLSHRGTFQPDFSFLDSSNRRADVGLTTQIPLDLTIDTASGSSTVDLSKLQLSRLAIDAGSGSVNLSLPGSSQAYPAKIQSASGSANIEIAEGANLNLDLDTGSGSVSISLPSNAGVKIDVRDNGSGSVSVPSGMVQTSGSNRDRGTWETANFSTAQNKIVITVLNRGSGSISFSD